MMEQHDRSEALFYFGRNVRAKCRRGPLVRTPFISIRVELVFR
jgi:hypothetical protein